MQDRQLNGKGNITEVHIVMTGVNSINRDRLFTVSTTPSTNSHHVKPVRVSFKMKTNMTPAGNLRGSISPKPMQNFTWIQQQTDQTLGK